MARAEAKLMTLSRLRPADHLIYRRPAVGRRLASRLRARRVACPGEVQRDGDQPGPGLPPPCRWRRCPAECHARAALQAL